MLRNIGCIVTSKNLISIMVPIELLDKLEEFRYDIGAESKKIYLSEKYAQFQFSSKSITYFLSFIFGEK